MSILNVKNEPLLSGDFWQNMSCQFPPKYSSLGCTVTVVSTICYQLLLFFKHTPYRGACESAFRFSVRLDQCANGTANISHSRQFPCGYHTDYFQRCEHVSSTIYCCYTSDVGQLQSISPSGVLQIVTELVYFRGKIPKPEPAPHLQI